ncbi:unnamed protein product [Vicia faba]|uniref:Endonuclease/exonuclease/phosphatase domain-containing protein n=1 Tax=Vicia faba TaxID=3906 RepID=A0AAV0Z530_VICFA|nr:unnamed protein product [Vicia faba]
MIIDSFNIRGGGNTLKRRKISSLIKKGNVEIFLIQETKISNLQDYIARSFWSNTEVGFSFTNSRGMSGNLVTLWRIGDMEVLNSFKGEGFLGVKIVWKGNLYYVVNFYSYDVRKKICMRARLLELNDSYRDVEWIIGGDFNIIKINSERKGRGAVESRGDMKSFEEFIGEISLVDIPCKGKKFTWYSGDGKSMSRIDRFLVADNIVNRWGVVGQLIGDRDISDHCPIWLVKDDVNWGPKPFKFNNEWFSFDSFIPFVKKEWKDLNVEGKGDFVLKEKLKLL